MRKLTIEYIREQFEKEGYKLLSKEYINNKQKLDYICPKGHEHVISWHEWGSNKNRCPYCSGKIKKTIEFIRSEFEKEGYELLSKEYVNAHQKLDYICPKGHKHNITWNSWASGYRCFDCFGSAKLTIEFIKSEFAKEGYKLLTKKYKNNKQKLDYICPNGHRHSISWNKWQYGERCPSCRYDSAKLTIGFIRSEFEKEGYELLSEKYINAQQLLNYICPNEHRHSIRWGNWQQGQRCPFCVITASKGEIQVRNFIKSFDVEVLPNDRNQIFSPETGYGLELDVFMPTLNKAIEYNGEYWHRDESKDLLKRELCESKGIDLLIIWDEKWNNDVDYCKRKIKTFIFEKERNYGKGI